MLTKVERKLLENTLDALDRVFDRQSHTVDLYALVFATGNAFSEDRFRLIFERPMNDLEKIIRSQLTADQKRNSALEITDDLRKFVAGELSRDASTNPRQRHVK